MNVIRIAQPGRLGQPWVREVVPGVFRVGTTFLGCYAVEDAGAYTFIDVGLPGYWPQITMFLAARNAPLSSVKAVVLTHCHPDHMGNAERLRTQAGAAVLVHHDDRAAAMRKATPSWYPLWKPPVLHLVGHFLRNGVARTAPVAEASGFADDDVLDVPGRPRVIHTPGHTAGNVALNLAGRDVLIVVHTCHTVAPAAASASSCAAGALWSVITASRDDTGPTAASAVRVNLEPSATTIVRRAEAIAARLTAASGRS